MLSMLQTGLQVLAFVLKHLLLGCNSFILGNQFLLSPVSKQKTEQTSSSKAPATRGGTVGVGPRPCEDFDSAKLEKPLHSLECSLLQICAGKAP